MRLSFVIMLALAPVDHPICSVRRFKEDCLAALQALDRRCAAVAPASDSEVSHLRVPTLEEELGAAEEAAAAAEASPPAVADAAAPAVADASVTTAAGASVPAAADASVTAAAGVSVPACADVLATAVADTSVPVVGASDIARDGSEPIAAAQPQPAESVVEATCEASDGSKADRPIQTSGGCGAGGPFQQILPSARGEPAAEGLKPLPLAPVNKAVAGCAPENVPLGGAQSRATTSVTDALAPTATAATSPLAETSTAVQRAGSEAYGAAQGSGEVSGQGEPSAVSGDPQKLKRARATSKEQIE